MERGERGMEIEEQMETGWKRENDGKLQKPSSKQNTSMRQLKGLTDLQSVVDQFVQINNKIITFHNSP